MFTLYIYSSSATVYIVYVSVRYIFFACYTLHWKYASNAVYIYGSSATIYIVCVYIRYIYLVYVYPFLTW